jgi:hypothetical protein
MTGSIYNDNSSSAELISTAVQELLRQARALGLTWTLRLATVVTNAPDSMTAIYDGDTVALSMVNMTGATLDPEERVYGLIIPPAGNFIIGRVVKVGPVGRVDSKTFAGNADTVELIVLTTETITFLGGRTYRIRWRFSTATNGPGSNQSLVRVRLGSTTSGTDLGDSIYVNLVGFGQEARYGAIYVTFGRTISSPLILTQQAQLSIGVISTASATNVFYLEAEEVGPMTKYPNALVVNS